MRDRSAPVAGRPLVVCVVCLLTAQLCAAADVPVVIKLTPDVTDMRPIAAKVKEAGPA